MITLPIEFKSGEGGFSTDPLTYKQIKRDGNLALYERSREGKVYDYELIIITVVPKGTVQKFPNGVIKTIEDDTEHYPSTGSFGKKAWALGFDRVAAEKYFEERLTKRDFVAVEKPEEETAAEVEIPVSVKVDGEFSTKEYAEKNKMDYPTAYLAIKAGLADGTIKFIREERRNVKGKPTKLFIMV